jgi:FdhD protein
MNCFHQIELEKEPAVLRPILRWRNAQWVEELDSLAVEVPVALEFNGISHAVMLATPSDLESFALGFALSEGIVDRRQDFRSAEVETSEAGITVHCEISDASFMRLKERRRNMTGRTGCGLCGVESLEQVLRPMAVVQHDAQISVSAIHSVLQSLDRMQPLSRLTGGMHAAAWSDRSGNLQDLCEDVGRHNALDKLIGKRAGEGLDFEDGFLLITSRASVEMVQKAAAMGIPAMVAISAPTSLAVETAEAFGLTLIAFARGKDFVAYAHAGRIREA